VSHDQFDTLVAAYHGEIYRYLLLVTGKVVDAQDLSQETFVQTFKARRSPWHVTSARSWLFAIATDLCRSRLRSGRRPARRFIEEEDRATNGGQQQDAVAMAITRLPAEERIALALRKLHDFDYEAIGRMLGCSSGGARDRVMRAVRKLARMPSVRAAPHWVTTPGTPDVPASSATAAPT
jgi:RNA polymerase sigma-70 factor (ECF subfamily)